MRDRAGSELAVAGAVAAATLAREWELAGAAVRAGAEVDVATDDAQLQQLARQRDGWLDFIAVGDTADRQGQWAFTSYIVDDGGALGSLTPDDVSAQGATAAASSLRTRPPSIRIAVTRPLPASTARASQMGRCQPRYQTQTPQKTSEYALVGELNNAYNDGTSARFTYAREHTADTDFGIASSNDGGDTFSIGGQNHIGDTGSLAFPTVQRRWARKLKTKFEFTREAVRTDTCAVWSIYIRATGWLLGTDSDTKQSGTMDKCDAGWVGKNSSGADFKRDTNRAVRWTHGAAAFGVWLTTQSGFSRNVTTEYAFHGPPGKAHYLCGPDGRQDPSTAGRIFSGALK